MYRAEVSAPIMVRKSDSFAPAEPADYVPALNAHVARVFCRNAGQGLNLRQSIFTGLLHGASRLASVQFSKITPGSSTCIAVNWWEFLKWGQLRVGKRGRQMPWARNRSAEAQSLT